MPMPMTTRGGLMCVLAALCCASAAALRASAAAVTFLPASGPPNRTVTASAVGATSVFAADLDGDGDLDLLAASQLDDTVAWYENRGAGAFDPAPRVLTAEASGAVAVFAADLDGDGDADVVSASRNDGTVAWYRNDGAGGFDPDGTGAAIEISRHLSSPRAVFVADLDGDGRPDVLAASSGDDRVVWFRNEDGAGAFGPARNVTEDADAVVAVFAADVDGDGDLDVLSASTNDDTVAWHENLDGAGGFGPRRVITAAAGTARAVFAADLDGDGDLDVLFAAASTDTVAWHENVDGAGTFGPERVLTAEADGPYAAFAADIDGDGDLDVVACANNADQVLWFENVDGGGAFGPPQVISATADRARSVFAADLDGDGDVDVASASYGDGAISWYENNPTVPHAISADEGGANAVVAADLDGDGNLDVLSAAASAGRVAWFRNDGSGAFGARQNVTEAASGAVAVRAADLDGDGHLDVLVASQGDDTVAWFANNGTGGFGPPRSITTSAAGAAAIFVADLDGDGDPDVLAASAGDGVVSWFANNGTGAFGAGAVISAAAAQQPRSVHAADLDGDGDLDVLAAFSGDGSVAWFENNGTGGFGPRQTIAAGLDGAYAVIAANLDGDSDLDVVVAAVHDDRVVWFENDGGGGFGPPRVVTLEADGARSVHAADVDGDGDLDVLSASSGDGKVAWYENDGTGVFGPQRVVAVAAYAAAVSAADVNGDGSADVLSASFNDNTVAWYDLRRPRATLQTAVAVRAPADGGNDTTCLVGPTTAAASCATVGGAMARLRAFAWSAATRFSVASVLLASPVLHVAPGALTLAPPPGADSSGSPWSGARRLLGIKLRGWR